ncbi:unnamed protein product, partial [Rotaria socialis]
SFFMGSLRSQLINYPNLQSVSQQIKNVHQMRGIFIDYIIHLDSNHFLLFIMLIYQILAIFYSACS